MINFFRHPGPKYTHAAEFVEGVNDHTSTVRFVRGTRTASQRNLRLAADVVPIICILVTQFFIDSWYTLPIFGAVFLAQITRSIVELRSYEEVPPPPTVRTDATYVVRPPADH